jgi:predicted hotdog family 3-hydroxylacyl-ACP dehydratase
MMVDCTKYAVDELIPHSPPMVLLDRILHYDSMNLIAEITINVDCMFYDPAVKGVPSWVGIEYMAQAISALAGLRAREKNASIKIGFLLGTRKMLLQQKVLLAGGTYQIHVKQLFWDPSGLANFECEIRHGQELCVTAKVNVFETDDVTKVTEVSNG